MIKVLLGEEPSVYNSLGKIEEVKEIYRLFGEFDFFIVLQADSRKSLDYIINQMRDDSNVVKIAEVLFTAGSDAKKIEEIDYAGVLA